MATTSNANSQFLYNGPDYNTFVGGKATLTFDVIDDPRVVVSQLIVRAWLAAPGSLDDPNVGLGLRKYLNASLTSSQFEELRALMRTQAVNVDGVQDCSVTMTATPAQGGGVLLTATAQITMLTKTGTQTFATVFALSHDTTQLIVAGKNIG